MLLSWFQYYICFLSLCCWRPLSVILGSDKQALYVADDNEIRSLYPGMQNWIYEQAFHGDANVRIDAMDLHIKSKRIFWTNWHTGRISSFEQPSAGPASPNSNRNRRQTDSRVTDLEVSAAQVWRECERLAVSVTLPVQKQSKPIFVSLNSFRHMWTWQLPSDPRQNNRSEIAWMRWFRLDWKQILEQFGYSEKAIQSNGPTNQAISQCIIGNFPAQNFQWKCINYDKFI